MARAQRLPAAAGHNSGTPLTDEEREALGVHHQIKIADEQRKLAVLLVDVSAQRKLVNGSFKRMTADLHYTRDQFQREVLDKLNMTAGEYASYVKTLDQLHRIAGLKQGEQIDIEHILNDTVDESEAAFQDGYRAGRRADDPKPGSHVSGIMQPKWMEGYHAGQAYNATQLTKAADILARPKPGEMVAGEDPEAEEEDDGDPEVLKRKARELKKSGWMDPTPEEQSFDQAGDLAAAELTH